MIIVDTSPISVTESFTLNELSHIVPNRYYFVISCVAVNFYSATTGVEYLLQFARSSMKNMQIHNISFTLLYLDIIADNIRGNPWRRRGRRYCHRRYPAVARGLSAAGILQLWEQLLHLGKFRKHRRFWLDTGCRWNGVRRNWAFHRPYAWNPTWLDL